MGGAYAQTYEVRYWAGTGDAMDEQASGDWKTYASGKVENGNGKNITLRLDPSRVSTRWVRVLMSELQIRMIHMEQTTNEIAWVMQSGKFLSGP